MGNYFEPVLLEEQLAAYLDGMLTTEENNMVEELIDSNPGMAEIQEAIDSVDSTFIYEIDEEIPIECMADDFILPDVDYGNSGMSYKMEEYVGDEGYDDGGEYQDDSNEMNYQDETSELEHESMFAENEFEDMSF